MNFNNKLKAHLLGKLCLLATVSLIGMSRIQQILHFHCRRCQEKHGVSPEANNHYFNCSCITEEGPWTENFDHFQLNWLCIQVKKIIQFHKDKRYYVNVSYL